MMAGAALWVIGPTGFIAGFVISEIISHLSNLKEEDFLMVKKAIRERKKLHEPRHRVSGGPPPFQAKPAEELVKLKRKGF